MSRSVSSAGSSGVGRLLQATRCLALDSLAIRTSELFASAGIECLLLKGPATAHRIFASDPGMRSYCDVDLLVAPDRFDVAQEVLQHAGYRWLLAGIRADEMPWHETAWAAPGDQLTVDLHRGFAGVHDPTAFWDQLWQTHGLLELAGGELAVPGLTGAALIIVLHAASPGKSRKPLDDLRRAFDVLDPGVWAAGAELATLVRAEASWRAGIELLPEGRDLTRRLGATALVSTDQWLAGRQSSRVSVNLAAAVEISNIRDRVRFVVRKAIPSPALMRLFDPRARRHPGGLVLAYLRRWGQLVVQAPAAVRDVHRARRATTPRSVHPWVRRLSWVRRTLLNRPTVNVVRIRAALWALQAHRCVRRDLGKLTIAQIAVSSPPTCRSGARGVVSAVLRVRGGTCLEKSLILQRFDQATGRNRDLIIGTTSPGLGFRAHAWLDGDTHETMFEITRRPAPGVQSDPADVEVVRITQTTDLGASSEPPARRVWQTVPIRAENSSDSGISTPITKIS